MNLQVLFNRVCEHLVKQGVPSLDESAMHCKYRGSGGNSCAVGCLIKDEYYHKDLEGMSLSKDTVGVALNKSLGYEISDDERCLLQALQMSHDGADRKSVV